MAALDRRAERRSRERFVARVRSEARKVNATVDLQLADDLKVGKDIDVRVDQGSHTVVHLGERCSLGDRVLLMLKGGELLVGDRVDIRRDVVMNITGRLRIVGDTPISWGSVIHCSNDVHLDRMVGIAEQVTIADSSHFFTTPDAHFWHNVRKGSVRVGRNTWICPKAVLTKGADVGSHCIVGSGSVVTGIVPDGHLASGVPATLKPLALPWTAQGG